MATNQSPEDIAAIVLEKMTTGRLGLQSPERSKKIIADAIREERTLGLRTLVRHVVDAMFAQLDGVLHPLLKTSCSEVALQCDKIVESSTSIERMHERIRTLAEKLRTEEIPPVSIGETEIIIDTIVTQLIEQPAS